MQLLPLPCLASCASLITPPSPLPLTPAACASVVLLLIFRCYAAPGSLIQPIIRDEDMAVKLALLDALPEKTVDAQAQARYLLSLLAQPYHQERLKQLLATRWPAHADGRQRQARQERDLVLLMLQAATASHRAMASDDLDLQPENRWMPDQESTGGSAGPSPAGVPANDQQPELGLQRRLSYLVQSIQQAGLAGGPTVGGDSSRDAQQVGQAVQLILGAFKKGLLGRMTLDDASQMDQQAEGPEKQLRWFERSRSSSATTTSSTRHDR